MLLAYSVLPKKLREQLVRDLDKRLDLDLDEILDSPKLRLKLSPAELDKSLLDFYNSIVKSPGGDVFRMMVGGGRIGLQNLYMKHQDAKRSRRKLESGAELDLLPAAMEEVFTAEQNRTATEWVKWALSRNLPLKTRTAPNAKKKKPRQRDSKQMTPRMCWGEENRCRPTSFATWTGLRSSSPSLLPRHTARTSKFSILI
jgi:hypothetical protein